MTKAYICPVECTECPIEDCVPRRLKLLIGYKQMSNLWYNGVNMADVADRFGVQRKTVSNAVDADRAGQLTRIPLVSIR